MRAKEQKAAEAAAAGGASSGGGAPQQQAAAQGAPHGGAAAAGPAASRGPSRSPAPAGASFADWQHPHPATPGDPLVDLAPEEVARLLEEAKGKLPQPFREDGPQLAFVFDPLPEGAPESLKRKLVAMMEGVGVEAAGQEGNKRMRSSSAGGGGGGPKAA